MLVELCTENSLFRARVAEYLRQKERPAGSSPAAPGSRGASPSPSRPRSSSPSRLFSTMPAVLPRVTLRKNGSLHDCAVLAPSNFAQLLDLATQRVGFIVRRIFNDEGRELHQLSELAAAGTLYASAGEPWLDPRNPELNSVKRAAAMKLPPLSDNLLKPHVAKYVFVHRNGSEHDPLRLVGDTVAALLRDATTRLALTSAARYLFTDSGTRIVDSGGESPSGGNAPAIGSTVKIGDVPSGSHVYVSTGEPWQDPAKAGGARTYIKPLPEKSRLNPPARAWFMVSLHGVSLGQDDRCVRIVPSSVRDLVRQASERLNLVVPIKRVFTTRGEIVLDKVPALAKAAKDRADDGAPSAGVATAASGTVPLVHRIKRRVHRARKNAAAFVTEKRVSSAGSSSGSSAGAASEASHDSYSYEEVIENAAAPPAPPERTSLKFVALSAVPRGEHLLLSQSVTFEHASLVSNVAALPQDSRLLPVPQKRFLILKLGETVLREGVYVVGTKVHALLEACQVKFILSGRARKLYTFEGKTLVDSLASGVEVPHVRESPGTSALAAAAAAVSPGAVRRVVGAKVTSAQADTGALAASATNAGVSAAAAAAPRPLNLSPEDYVELGSLENDTILWVSTGAPFVPVDRPAETGPVSNSHIPPIPADSGLLQKPGLRVRVFRNGWYEGKGKTIVGFSIAQLLQAAESVCALPSSAKALFDLDGKPITRPSDITADMKVAVTMGEPFSKGVAPRREAA